MIVEIEIADVVAPQGFLPRVLTGTLQEKVEEYTEMIQEGVEFDPISVWKKGNEYWVIDGVHRLSAHKKAGKTTIKAKLVECKDELDYRIKAIQANLKHGLALAKEERPLLAQILYKEGLSQEEIRKIFGISDRTLHRWLEQVKEQEKREKINKALELKEQGWTQEQIAKELGVEKGTISKWLQKVSKLTTWQNGNIYDKDVGNISQQEEDYSDWIRGWEEAVREEEEKQKPQQKPKTKEEKANKTKPSWVVLEEASREMEFQMARIYNSFGWEKLKQVVEELLGKFEEIEEIKRKRGK